MPRISKSEEDRRYASVIRHLDAYKAARFRNGDDKTAVASALGLSPARMYRILSGSADTLTLREIITIANTLNISVQALLGCREERTI